MYRCGLPLLIDAHTCTIPATWQSTFTPGGAGGVAVGVGVRVGVGVGVGVHVAVAVGVLVMVTVGLAVGVAVSVGVAVGQGEADDPVANGKKTGPAIKIVDNNARAMVQRGTIEHHPSCVLIQPHTPAAGQHLRQLPRRAQPPAPGV